MNGAVHPEILLAIGYAGFLVVVAVVLELLARHTQHRAEQYRLVGFKYHHGLDVWECPTGQHLHRHFTHPEAPVVRYRASAHACNHCALKHRCTDSDQGREITRTTFGWLDTEIGRFHRGISIALLLLAQFILGLELLRFHTALDRWMLAGVLVPLSLSWMRMVGRFRASSSAVA